MRITLASIQDYKRIRDITIAPPADTHVVLVGGNNRQGKTSLLDSLTVAFGGKKLQAADPVRHGAEEARIHIETDTGLIIDRTIQPDGSSSLEVRDKNGRVSSPQTMLDKLIGSRFLDPIAFLALKPPEQRAQLLAIIDKENLLSKLEERREKIYNNRTDVGRNLKNAEGELARLPREVKVEAPIDVGALSAEAAAFAEEQRIGEAIAMDASSLEREHRDLHNAANASEARIKQLESELAAEREKRAGMDAKADKLGAAIGETSQRLLQARQRWAESADRRAAVAADLARANGHNRAVVEGEQSNRRRSDAAAVVKRLEIQRDSQTEQLNKIDAQKLAFLQQANLPVVGLGVEPDGVTYNGVPLAQASGAEKHRVALALAIAASPNLDDIWIRDGALLDDDSLEMVVRDAEAAGKVVWIERVGSSDDGAIIISDGTVLE